MLPGAADSADDPLEQDAPDHQANDPAIPAWFLAEGDRANRATDLRAFTIGNLVTPLVDGREYTRPHPGRTWPLSAASTWGTAATTTPSTPVTRR
jgi:hypothetical protein